MGAAVDVGVGTGGLAAMGAGALGNAGFGAMTSSGHGQSWSEFGKGQLKDAAVGGALGGLLSKAAPLLAEIPGIKPALEWAGRGVEKAAGTAVERVPWLAYKQAAGDSLEALITKPTKQVFTEVVEGASQLPGKAREALAKGLGALRDEVLPNTGTGELRVLNPHFTPDPVGPNKLMPRIVTEPSAGEGGVYAFLKDGKVKTGSTADFRGRYGPRNIELEYPQTRFGPAADDAAYRWTPRRQRRFDEEFLDRSVAAPLRYRSPIKPVSPVQQWKWEDFRQIFGYGDTPADFGH